MPTSKNWTWFFFWKFFYKIKVTLNAVQMIVIEMYVETSVSIEIQELFFIYR